MSLSSIRGGNAIDDDQRVSPSWTDWLVQRVGVDVHDGVSGLDVAPDVVVLEGRARRRRRSVALTVVNAIADDVWVVLAPDRDPGLAVAPDVISSVRGVARS
jgi:hypothetical protein